MAADMRNGRGNHIIRWWMLLVATAGFVSTACSSGSAAPAHSPGRNGTTGAGLGSHPSAATPTGPPAGWVRHAGQSWSTAHGPSVGVTIAIPAAWHFNNHPAPALLSPAMLFAAGTGPVPSGGSCAPTAALKTLPANGALFALYEYPHAGFPARPRHLHLGLLGGPYECWGVKGYVITFEDGRRYFQAQVVFGARAPAWLRAEVVRSLNTLQVDPLPAS
jgi:hypothetical protein